MSRIEQLKQMLQAEPNDLFLNYALALELVKQENFSEAISTFQFIIEKDKNYLAAYYQLGKAYEEISDTEKAKHAYTLGIAIAKEQKNTKTLSELNSALMNVGDIYL